MKSLCSRGKSVTLWAFSRVSREPPNHFSSVNTEMAFAPPASKSDTTSSGTSLSTLLRPGALDFTSEISDIGSPGALSRQERKAEAKPSVSTWSRKFFSEILI